MSKQLYFAHSEIDIPLFIDFIYKSGGVIVINGSVAEDGICDRITEQMCTGFSRFYILPNDVSATNDAPPMEKHMIEVLNCSRANTFSRTYDIGRLYYKNDCDHEINAKLVKVYDKLCYHMKREYIYCKKSKIYVSKDFLGKYQLGHYHTTSLGMRFSIS